MSDISKIRRRNARIILLIKARFYILSLIQMSLPLTIAIVKGLVHDKKTGGYNGPEKQIFIIFEAF